MSIKLIPRLKPHIGLRELLAAVNIFKRQSVDVFEKQFAAKFENRHGVMFSHGRVGLYTLFKIWGLKTAEIICPAYTCVVVPHAIVLSDNIPVFVDCAENSFNMSYEGIEKAMTHKTRAVVVTHLFGYPMDVYRINNIVRDAEKKYGHKIYIVQDVAHSFGCKWAGELVTKFGDAALFGLNISKTITSIFGGMITTNDAATYQGLKDYRYQNFKKPGVLKIAYNFVYLLAVKFAFNHYIYGFVNKLERMGWLNYFVKYYDEDKIYFPKDWETIPSGMQARVGMVQLKKYDAIIERRKRKAMFWINELSNAHIRFMPHIDGATYSHCVGIVENREEWIVKYKKESIQLGILIEYAVPYMKAYKGYYKDVEFPISKCYSKHIINLPNHKQA